MARAITFALGSRPLDAPQLGTLATLASFPSRKMQTKVRFTRVARGGGRIGGRFSKSRQEALLLGLGFIVQANFLKSFFLLRRLWFVERVAIHGRPGKSRGT